MSQTDTATARREAIERIIEVLQQEYSTELGNIQDTNLPLPSPSDSDYYAFYWQRGRQEQLENSEVACYVAPNGPRQLVTQGARQQAPNSGTYEQRELPVLVAVMFIHAFHEPVSINGRSLTTFEVADLRAERYAGALDETIRKYAWNGDAGILSVEMSDDDAIIFDSETDDPLIGVAMTEFELTLYSEAPVPQSLP